MRQLTPALLAAAALVLAPAAALAWDQAAERENFERVGQRLEHEQADPAFQADSAQLQAADLAGILVRDVAEGGERFSGSLCGSGTLTCAGDPRTYEWSGGTERPVQYVNRNGAVIEGQLWLANGAESGAPRPGVVIQTGSVQAPARWYRWIAQVLASRGYLVLTFDVQGQGRSDFGGTHDQHFFDGVPAQDIGHFVEDLEDALDFLVSAPAAPYVPRTPHGAAKQAARHAAGKAELANPFAAVLDRSRIGIVGHSLGAQSVSIVQETDPRVDAVVAWDNLSSAVTPRVPALGMSADYGLVPLPRTSEPGPDSRNGGFARWSAAGIDAMQVNIRGGTHYEWSYAPSVLPATLRGIDTAAWYTAAWLDRYVKGDAAATALLLTDRFRADPIDAEVDPDGGGSLFSSSLRSPIAIAGTSCTDLGDATACPLLADDGRSREQPYSWLSDRG